MSKDEALKWIDQIEKIAFEISPANGHTPRIVTACICARNAILDARETAEAEVARLTARVAVLAARVDELQEWRNWAED